MSKSGNRRWAAFFILATLMGGALAQTAHPGLQTAGAETIWPRWQGRVLVGAVTPPWRHLGWEHPDSTSGAHRLESLSVLGDYYFSNLSDGARASGGFRATSGLIFGSASSRSLSAFWRSGLHSPMGAAGTAPGTEAGLQGTLPYLGLGYTSVSARNGWGFSADIGLIARNPGSAVKLGRVVGGNQALEDLLREMRLSPLLNLGVSYSF